MQISQRTNDRFREEIPVRVDHLGPHRGMAENNRNAQLRDDGAAHEVLAEDEKLETRHARRSASKF